MATVAIYLTPEEAAFRTSAFPAYVVNQGTDFPVSGLAFDASTNESAFWKFSPLGYVATNTITVDIIWYADTSTTSTHTVRWEAVIAAITPNSDTQNVETKAYGSTLAVDLDLSSTSAQLLKKTTVGLSQALSVLDSAAPGDEVWLRIARIASNANDDLTGDAIITSVRLSYSDT